LHTVANYGTFHYHLVRLADGRPSVPTVEQKQPMKNLTKPNEIKGFSTFQKYFRFFSFSLPTLLGVVLFVYNYDVLVGGWNEDCGHHWVFLFPPMFVTFQVVWNVFLKSMADEF